MRREKLLGTPLRWELKSGQELAAFQVTGGHSALTYFQYPLHWCANVLFRLSIVDLSALGASEEVHQIVVDPPTILVQSIFSGDYLSFGMLFKVPYAVPQECFAWVPYQNARVLQLVARPWQSEGPVR